MNMLNSLGSRLLPKVSVSLHSSLTFPEPQVRTDCKNLFTWCYSLFILL